MQLLFTESEENGLHRGLNLLPGSQVRRLPQGVKIPRVGGMNCALSNRTRCFTG